MQTESPPSWPLRFVGSGSEYFRIWIVNLLLTIVTLGMYYPFAKVRKLKYFHGATELAGHPFGFHADPWKMWRGYVLVGVMVGLYSVAGQVSPMAGLIAFVIVAVLWPTLWHSSLRFRLANTSWRGLRFGFRGTRGGAYAPLAAPLLLGFVVLGLTAWLIPDANEGPPVDADPAFAWLGLVPLLLVLAAGPVFLWLVHRYKQAHMALGPEHTRFEARIGSYWVVCLKTGLVSLLPFLVVAASLGLVFYLARPGATEGEPSTGLALLPMVGVVLSYVAFFAVAGGYFTARMQNLKWSRTRTQNLSFESKLRARALIGLWVKNAFLTLLTLGLYFPFAVVASTRLRAGAVTVTSAVDLETLTAQAGALEELAAGDAAGDLLGLDIGL
jgi:uncharacterized membrane protein YjgN (DUF898 family)